MLMDAEISDANANRVVIFAKVWVVQAYDEIGNESNNA
jgi:hypothetical protein